MKENKKQQGKSKKDFKTVAAYKNHKRATKRKLVSLVGLHVLLIFCFCALSCTEYLTATKNEFLLEVISDVLFIAYFLLVLFAVKYKIKSLMWVSIVVLAVTSGLAINQCVMESLEEGRVSLIEAIEVVFVLLNCIVPWRFLILWNELKDSKWRETFDLRFKLSSHLLEEENPISQ